MFRMNGVNIAGVRLTDPEERLIHINWGAACADTGATIQEDGVCQECWAPGHGECDVREEDADATMSCEDAEAEALDVWATRQEERERNDELKADRRAGWTAMLALKGKRNRHKHTGF